MAGEQGAGPVLRIRVRRRGAQWDVVKSTRIKAMTLPRASELPDGHGRPLSGFWYELVDGSGTVQYRRVLRNPTEPSVEVPSEEGGFERVDIERPVVEFDVLVPDRDDADELRFFESDPRAGDTAATIARSREPVARLSIRKRPQTRRRKE